jgi:hypothetical protein
MPVEFINRKKGPRRLKFTRNTAYNGTDYGPDYGQDECLVEAPAAFRFIDQGRAVDLDAPPSPGDIQTRDPKPSHRDPIIASATEPPVIELGKLLKKDLLTMAQVRGLDVTEAHTKAELIALLEASMKQKHQ